MSLTLVAQLVPEVDVATAVGHDAALVLDTLLAPESAVMLSFADATVTVTLGPYIEVASGGGGGLTGLAGETINGHRVVAWAADGTLVHAQPANIFAIAGLTTAAASIGGVVTAANDGAVTFSGWAWTAGPVFLGADGTLTQTLPASGYAVVIGRGDGTRLFINLQPPVAVQ